MSAGTPYKQGEFCWNELGTRDIESALRFYKELFGWGTLSHDMGEYGTYYIFQLDGNDTGAGYRMSGPQFEGIPPHWASYAWVDDVDATAAKAGARGGQVLQPPMDVPNVGRMAFLKDPQGATFAVFKGKEHQGAARLGPKPGTFCWNELMTTDAAKARDFYSAVLGWTFAEMPMGPGGTYTVFKAGETNAAGMMEMKGPQFQGVPPHWMPYISVADCDAAASKAANLGATVLVPPTDIPKTGRFAVIDDPSGAVCGILALLPM
jgi:hypothetical protein